ncbi:MAG TPA: phosphatase PAP2 family protein [Bacteroidales bacterium]|nr:phosphatase PAP2 family protein [Bacteroidales bacterium]
MHRFISFLVFSLGIFSLSYSQNIDVKILDRLNSPNELKADPAMKFISNSTTYAVVGVPLCIGATALVKRDSAMLSKAIAIGASLAVAEGFAYALKYTVKRKRPFETYDYICKKLDGGDPSFPSGHTTAAFSTATSLSLAYPKWYVIAPSYVWATSVGYSRIHLGVHYPSDVLAGAVLGTASAYATYKLNLWFHKKYLKNRRILKWY